MKFLMAILLLAFLIPHGSIKAGVIHDDNLLALAGGLGPVGSPDESLGPVGSPDADTPPSPAASTEIINPLKARSITEFLAALIQVILVFATPLIVFFIIFAGFKYVVARGNPEKIKEAHNALLYAIIGGVIILGAFVILDVIKGTVDSFTI